MPSASNKVRVLVPGCGDSLLSEKLATQMGYSEVISIDFEPEVVNRMQSRGVSGITYQVMDMLDLKFESDSF